MSFEISEYKNKITVVVIKTNKLKNSKISSLPFFSFNEGMKNCKKAFLGPSNYEFLSRLPFKGLIFKVPNFA